MNTNAITRLAHEHHQQLLREAEAARTASLAKAERPLGSKPLAAFAFLTRRPAPRQQACLTC